MEGVAVPRDLAEPGDGRTQQHDAMSPEDAPEAFTPKEWVPARAVRIKATALGLNPRMLRRLSSAGVLAACRQRGQGYGRGRAGYYPRRALAQLEAVANARPHRVSPTMLRHLVWWQPGGRLEHWDRWRADRVTDLLPSVPAWDLEPAWNGALPDDREAAMVELASWLGARHEPLPGGARRLHDEGDRQALVRLVYSLVLKDDLLTDLAGATDEIEARARLQAILGQAVDGEPGEPAGRSFGELLERGLGKPAARTRPGVPGELAVAMFAFMPAPAHAAAQMTALSEPRARAARDALIAWSAQAGSDYGAQLRALPELAGLMTLTWDTMGSHIPAVLEIPSH